MVVAFAALPISACGTARSTCSGGGLAPLIVTVTDSANQVDVCNAVVAVNGSGTSLRLDLSGGDASCAYTLGDVDITGGTYTLSVDAPGFASATQQVTLAADDCGHVPATKFVTIALART